MVVTVIPIVTGALGTVPKGLGRGLGELKIRGTSRDHPNYSSVTIGQNTEKSPGDLRRLAANETWCEKLSKN